jgi:hypothetical protein
MKEYMLTFSGSWSHIITTTDIKELIDCIEGATGEEVTEDDIENGAEFGEVTDELDSVTVTIYE